MNLHNINTIAHYEVKLLRRSWLFRIFAVLALLGVCLAILIYQTNVLNRFDNVWPRIAVSSLMPFSSVYFYNLAQSIIVIFLAGSFLKRDKKLDTAEVIYVRPMSNADYMIGKTWGIVKVFVSLNLITLLITAFLNILINRSPFSIFPYLFYLFTISVPSLIFVLGLSFTAMCLLKNQAVTFIVMLGFTGTVFFYLSDSLFGVFDFFGVSIPAIFSDVTGHADLRLFLLQRFIYLAAGIGLIIFTIALVKRLPHKPWKVVIVYSVGGLCLAGACIAGVLYVYHYRHQLHLRNEYIASFNQYADAPKAEVLTHDITVTPHDRQLEAHSTLQLTNTYPEPLEKIILYLNPSLEVLSVKAGQSALPFTRTHQVMVIDRPLKNGEKLDLSIEYKGGITEAICYTDVLQKDYLDNSVPKAFYRFGKRYAWLENTFTLLTPECIWYPVSIPPVNPASPYNLEKNFTKYSLTVISGDDKTVLSQGKSHREGQQTIFTNDLLLPGISLTIADYEKKSIRVDSTDYALLYFRGHDYFSKYFDLLTDTLPSVIREQKNNLEIKHQRNYAYGKFVIAEVPVQFASYIRNWKGYTEYILPEIVFIPERGATLTTDFQAAQTRSREWRRHDEGAPDPTELEINNFEDFFEVTFLSEDVRYNWDWQHKFINKFNIAPLFLGYTGFIRSDEYPIIDIAVNTMQTVSSDAGGFRGWSGIINDKQRANLYLETHSFKEALSDVELKPEIFYELLKLKSLALKNYIYTRIPAKEFEDFLKAFVQKNNFRTIPLSAFVDSLHRQTGADLTGFLHRWFTEDHSPTLHLKDAEAKQVVIDEQTRYQIKFKVYNPSDVDAIITVMPIAGGREGGPRRGGERMFSVNSSEPDNYVVPAGEAVEIKLINDERPASISINTNISHNLPTSHSYNFSKIDEVTDDTTSGISTISPDAFKPDPKEIIIDNEDSGFKTIESNTRHKLKDIFQKKEKDKYRNFMPWMVPSKWAAMAAEYCYGETISSAVYKSNGSGNNSVVWTAEIPKTGYYEVFIWNAKMDSRFSRFGGRRGRNQDERNQSYTLEYDGEKETFTLDLDQENEGWVSLGNFYLPEGAASITLTDKVSGFYVIADAVKFTAIE